MFFDNLFDDFDPFGTYSYRQPRPQTSTTFRNDNRSIMIRKLLNDEYNYICFDCHRELNELNFFDLKNGIFLCSNCAQHHMRLSKEITQPTTGNIRTLEEKDLLILYYGGNKNLFDFIQRYYPLLENMQIKEKYSSKAMDYYRKLLRSKVYGEPEPNIPPKKKAYTSIFQKKVTPVREPREHREQQKYKNIRKNRMKDIDDNNDENNDDNLYKIFPSTFFGDDLFNRNKRREHKKEREEEEEENESEQNDDNVTMEPADINKKEIDEIDDAGMKVEKRKNSHNDKKEEKIQIPKTQRTINQFNHIDHQPKFKKIENKRNKKINNNENKNINNNEFDSINVLTINQLGELSRYPDAMEIDRM